MTRASFVLPVFVEGRVALVSTPGKNAWVQPFLNELLSFPNGRYDDQVDSLVQAIRWAERRVRPY
jgi:predicted phage terminase large subunit-like protein